MPAQDAAPNPAVEEVVPGQELDETSRKSAADEGEKENDPEKEEKRKQATGGFQKKIQRLSAEKTEAERRAEYWEREALRRQQADHSAKPATKTEPEDVEPEPNDYANVGEYLKAVRAYDRKVIAKEAKAEALKEFESKSKSERQKTVEEQRNEAWQKKLAAAREVYSDFDDAYEVSFPTTPAMTEALLDSELGAHIGYYFTQHPDEAARISKLSDAAQHREIGKLEVRIETQLSKDKPERDEESDEEEADEAPVKKAAAPLPKAPPPPTPIKKSSPTDKGLSDDLDGREWIKRRTAQVAEAENRRR